MLFSLVFIYYAYTGWNGASYLAGEIRDAQKILPRAILIGTGAVTLLYLAVNIVYALALSAGDVQAMVNAPENKEGLDAVAPIAEIAARRLFGPRWSNPLSVAIGLMLLSTLSAYCSWAPGDLRDGQCRPVPGCRGQADDPCRHPGRRHGTAGARHVDPALDRDLRADRGLRQRGALALLDAGHELDLRASLETAGSATSFQDARVPGDARGVSRADGAS